MTQKRGADTTFFAPEGSERQEITEEVNAEREAVADALGQALSNLIEPDVIIDNREIFYLHRQKDGADIYFIINPTYLAQKAQVSLPGNVKPVHWDPSTGVERLIALSQFIDGRTRFDLELHPVGSTFILVKPDSGLRIVDTNLNLVSINGNKISGYSRTRRSMSPYSPITLVGTPTPKS